MIEKKLINRLEKSLLTDDKNLVIKFKMTEFKMIENNRIIIRSGQSTANGFLDLNNFSNVASFSG
jgi:hypothetical protein